MKIISTQYTLKYKSFEIIVSGCSGKHCLGCHSPETWDFNIGDDYNEKLKSILAKIKKSSEMIDWIWIYGGEPLDNNLDDLDDMLTQLRDCEKPIMLFTRYDIKDVPENIKKLCDFIKSGRYKKDLTVDNNIQYGVKLATSNQKIYKKNPKGEWE